MTRREITMAALAILFALSALLLGACASPAPDLPAELPHYPCEQVKHGTTQYVACSADEWLHQEILKGKQ